MADDVFIAPDGSHIRVVSAGWQDLTDLVQALERIMELEKLHKVGRALVESPAGSEPMPRSMAYEGAKKAADLIAARMRVAILVSEIEPRHQFFENVAVNRGAALQFFKDEGAALTWLSNAGPADGSHAESDAD
jgi:hypothetical protein